MSAEPRFIESAQDVYAFIHGCTFGDLPAQTVHHAERCLLDLIGVAAGGSVTPLSRIIRDHAVAQFASPGDGVPILFDGRLASQVGAALAGGMTIDGLDAHDGLQAAKGHAGAALLPALLAFACGENRLDGRALLLNLVIGYEIACRAGLALHASVSDYHTSGAWNALGCAAMGSRILSLDAAGTREALGIAEYHGPRSQMMRCIDHPTMVKDGSGWGAMAGVSATLLARSGFTGAPAITIESGQLAGHWQDLGSRWLMCEQYLKPYPVCRWAQPAIEAAFSLVREHDLATGRIQAIEVTTFHEAARLAVRAPTSTEQAQYSLPFSVGIALSRGKLSAAEVTGEALTQPEALRLSRCITLHEDDHYNEEFPRERWAHVTLTLQDGTRLTSAPTLARGNPEQPLSDAEIETKFRGLCSGVIDAERAEAIVTCVNGLAQGADADQLIELVCSPSPHGCLE